MDRHRQATLSLLASLLMLAACGHHEGSAIPAAQDNFGVQMAKINLWREAMFRFQRAVDLNPSNAMAHNNLAVAYEANGDFEKARKEYLEALKLDRNNSYIQKNYSRFVEFLSRNKKRQQTTARTATPLGPGFPASSASGIVSTGAPPDKPTAAAPPPDVRNPPAKPSDLPQPAPPSPPPTPPPGEH